MTHDPDIQRIADRAKLDYDETADMLNTFMTRLKEAEAHEKENAVDDEE